MTDRQESRQDIALIEEEKKKKKKKNRGYRPI